VVRLPLAEPAWPDGALRRAAHAFLPRSVVAVWTSRAATLGLGMDPVGPRRIDHPARRPARGRHAPRPRTLRGRDRLFLGPGVAGRLALDADCHPVLAAPCGLVACLHRPALRVAIAPVVSYLAAGALRRRPAGPSGQPGRRLDRAARCRRARQDARLSRRAVQARPRAVGRRHRDALPDLRCPARGGLGHPAHRSGGTAGARFLGASRRRGAPRLRRAAYHDPTDRPVHPRDEPAGRYPTRLCVRRPRPLLDLPGAHRRTRSRLAAAAFHRRAQGAAARHGAGERAACLPVAPAARPIPGGDAAAASSRTRRGLSPAAAGARRRTLRRHPVRRYSRFHLDLRRQAAVRRRLPAQPLFPGDRPSAMA